MPFEFKCLTIPDVKLVKPRVFDDSRGFFMETFKESEFIKNGISEKFVQDNLSHSSRGTLRGLHYQKIPKAQGKLVMVLKGEVFDVAVDIRKGSPTYGKWEGIRLSDKKYHMLYIPPGFAHGFCVLSETSDFIYKTTDEYSPEHEAGIHWNDPAIGIEWPISDPILSTRDMQLPQLNSADNNFNYMEMR